MAKGRDASDWTLKFAGDDSGVSSDEYAGRFRVKPSGVVQIIWLQGKGPPPQESGPINQAAQEAIEAAIRPRA